MSTDFSFSQDTIGYIIEGVLDKKAVDDLHRQILEKLADFDKINLYIEVSNTDIITLNGLITGLIFPIKHAKRFDKIALISNRHWLVALTQLENLVTPFEVKHFSTEDRIKAMSWIISK